MYKKIVISILWLIFAVLFFILAGLHRAESKQTILQFKMTPIPPNMDIEFGKASLREILGNFERDFNNYLVNRNESNRKANLYAHRGYSLAGLTAFLAMGLEWQEYIFALLAKLLLLVKSQKVRRKTISKSNQPVGNH